MEEQKWAIIQYETVMKAQKAIREINKIQKVENRQVCKE